MEKRNFRVVKELVQPDSQGRLTLSAIAGAKSYRVMINDAGQILLDPVLDIPEREAWLWQNPEALASVQQGIEQSAIGQTEALGSFAQYANLELDE